MAPTTARRMTNPTIVLAVEDLVQVVAAVMEYEMASIGQSVEVWLGSPRYSRPRDLRQPGRRRRTNRATVATITATTSTVSTTSHAPNAWFRWKL
jgi:hypothetical protein